MSARCDLVAAIRWQKMNICSPPQRTGVYAVKHGRHWMYIGKAGNIAARITTKRHPIQITSGLDRYRFDYYWCPVPSDKLTRTENALIRAHNPEWNGGTSFGEGPSYWRWVTSKRGNSVRVLSGPQGPYCCWMGWLTEADILAAISG